MTRGSTLIRSNALLALIVVGAASCGPAPSPQPTNALAFERCGDVDDHAGAHPPRHRFCGQLELRDSGGNHRTIQVLLVSDRETDPLAERRLLAYHPGGPGVSAVELAGQAPPAVDLASFVVLAWDGTTASTTPGACGPKSVAFGTNRDAQHLATDAAEVGAECLFGFGGSEDIGAAAAADELEAIRLALRVTTFDLLAVSYGTAIGETYLRLHGGSVRRAVLDGPIALEAPWPNRLEAVGQALAEGADALARSCTTDRCAALAEPGASLTYAAIRRAVLAAAPAVGSGQTAFTPTILDQATELTLRSDAYWPAWSDAVDSALAGDGSALWTLGEKEYFDLDRSVFYRSICADIDRPANAAAFGAPADELLRAYTSALAPCSAFPHRELPGLFAGRAEDVLILASRHDVLAPSALLDSAPELRSLGSVCATNVFGHTSYLDPEIGALVASFLNDGELPPADACELDGI